MIIETTMSTPQPTVPVPQPRGEVLQIRKDASLSFLVHALSKIGKSTLSSTVPLPALVLDAEGGWRFIDEAGFQSGRPLRKIFWDPLNGPPPRHDGTWDVCIVIVQDWATLKRTYDWLLASPHDFISLVLDSISEIQRRCKKNIRSDGQMQMQDWGALLAQMDDLIRGFRDFTFSPHNNIRVAVFIAETRQDNGRYKPYVQGQISVLLPYLFDIVGYLFAVKLEDENGQLTRDTRRLLIGPHPEYEAGERVQGKLGSVIDDPDITKMINTVFPYTTESEEYTTK
jgi:hypothetical protein